MPAETKEALRHLTESWHCKKSYEDYRSVAYSPIARRRRALVEAGVFPFPDGYDDDLTGPDYVPMPTDDNAEPEQDVAEALRKARLAHMRKVSAKSSGCAGQSGGNVPQN
jgi:hypothetical protein